MTIAAETNRVTYSCNGVLTDFAFEFKVFSEDDLRITITDSGGTATVLTITTDYTVAGENGKFESGGTVSTVKEVDGTMGPYAWATGYSITIELDLDIKQETDLVYGGTYSTSDIERMADRLTKICQQLNDAINRSVVLSAASALSGLTIPDLIAGRYLYAADAETLGWAVSVDTTALTVSDWAKTLLDDVNAAAALGTLGFTAFFKTLIDDADAPTALKTLLSLLHTSIAKTATYTVTTADRGKLINFDCTTGNMVAELPAAATAGNGFAVAIKKTDAGANYLTVDPNGAELIDGSASHILRLQNYCVLIVCDGTGWKIIGREFISFLASLSLTNHGILLGSGTGAITPTAVMTNGQILVGQTASDPLPKTLTGDVTVSEAGVMTLGKVTQAKIKTSQGSVNGGIASSVSGTTYEGRLILPGGEYGFQNQKHFTASASSTGSGVMTDMLNLPNPLNTIAINLYVYYSFTPQVNGRSFYCYFTQRYVTSSGEVFWIFILRDKVTKAIISMSQSPDHPCFGNGGKPLLVSHPFGSYDPETQEIVVINPTEEELEEMMAKCVKGEDEPDKDLLEIIMEEYEIDEDSTPKWTDKEVTVGLPKTKDWKRERDGTPVIPIKKKIPKPDYIKVKSLRRKPK